MSRFIDELRQKRKKLADVLADEDYSGIREIVEELYPDKAHFIYELLQNAEDAGASSGEFVLKEDGLVFQHDGRPFSEADVEGITNIGKGAKRDSDDAIGRFGVGFKAVFAYSETPRIWSPTFSFEIMELVLPTEIPCEPKLGARTRFEFPFNNAKKPREIALREVQHGLDALPATVLLFLTQLRSIRWTINGESFGEVRRIEHSDEHIELVRRFADGRTESTHYLRFYRKVDGLEGQKTSLAFVLEAPSQEFEFDPEVPLGNQLRIVAARPGCVAVFFPAEKESSGLRFHLHAPFVPELSRASVKDTPANAPLFEQLAELAAESLHRIRDLGLLSGDFLAVLPNPEDHLSLRYERIRSRIVDEMNEKPLTPTNTRGHKPANQLVQANVALKALISPNEISFVMGRAGEALDWAMSVTQRNSAQDRFLNGLAIGTWDVTDLINVLKTSLRYREEYSRWIEQKTPIWHQQLYALLCRALEADGRFYELQSSRIVRVASGDYVCGGDAFFASDDEKNDTLLPRVDPEILSAGKAKAQQDDARRFLVGVGVREVGEREQIEAILGRRYSEGAQCPSNHALKKDLYRFLALLEKDPRSASIFKRTNVLMGSDNMLHAANEIYLDEPYIESGLDIYFAKVGASATRMRLNSIYKDLGVSTERLVRFAIALGALDRLPISRRRTESHPMVWSLRSAEIVQGAKRTSTSIDIDWQIDHLAAVLEEPTIEIARLVWDAMRRSRPEMLVAVYRPNQQHPKNIEPSSLVFALRDMAWVPQRGGTFVVPAHASSEALPPGFPFDSGEAWLRAIGFGAQLAQHIEKKREIRGAAEKLGFKDDNELDEALWFASLDPDQRKLIRARTTADLERHLPVNEPGNPDRRSERVVDQARRAPDRVSEKRERSVAVGVDAVKAEAQPYLKQQYTREDDTMVCQVCKDTLPFKLSDGSYYFEKVEFLKGLTKRHYQNFLALCPNHSAMFQHALDFHDESQTRILSTERTELPVILAGNQATIYFTATHFADLRALLISESSSGETRADNAV